MLLSRLTGRGVTLTGSLPAGANDLADSRPRRTIAPSRRDRGGDVSFGAGTLTGGDDQRVFSGADLLAVEVIGFETVSQRLGVRKDFFYGAGHDHHLFHSEELFADGHGMQDHDLAVHGADEPNF